MTDITPVAGLFIAYLLGSLPTALLVCHCMGITDPRQQGSGNPGATNVLRIGGPVAAALTLLGDMGKGLLAVAICAWLELSLQMQAAAGILAITGHIFPLFNRFQGGKGVATMLGSCLLLDYRLGLLQCFIWILLALLRRISSMAALAMALLSPALCWVINPELLPAVSMMGLMIIATHHQNIKKLLSGDEQQL
ncbi:MAG: glycerol-3-phosphate 1-O-acyltransferase PlsY [Amphritea sp.]|nr:glycerol-3-phosphate 1-O-acyltransferase PlsY [Amphritea sp.]